MKYTEKKMEKPSFFHGGPGMSDCRGDIAAFSSLGDEYKLVFMDMRGSGRSEVKPPYTHEPWTADNDGLRQQLGLAKIFILSNLNKQVLMKTIRFQD
jgi:pimeloyl-ACP methyl ester carboxylesterase